MRLVFVSNRMRTTSAAVAQPFPESLMDLLTSNVADGVALAPTIVLNDLKRLARKQGSPDCRYHSHPQTSVDQCALHNVFSKGSMQSN